MDRHNYQSILEDLQEETKIKLRLQENEIVSINDIPFKGIFQNTFRQHHLSTLLNAKTRADNIIVVGASIYEPVKAQLRAANIGYVDEAGNAFLKAKGLYVFIDGKKGRTNRKKLRHKAFTKTGLKLVFHLLLDPNLLQQTYRVIAATASISLDSVAKTFASLKELGFIVTLDERKIKLINQRELLNRWIYQYGDKLKPSLKIGQYRFRIAQNDWKSIKLNATTQWSGEPGGDLLTNYLHPEIWTLYTSLSRTELIKSYPIIPDERGRLFVYEQFWRPDIVPCIPPLLVYADLMYSGIARNIETARRIDEQYLQNQFGKAQE